MTNEDKIAARLKRWDEMKKDIPIGLNSHNQQLRDKKKREKLLQRKKELEKELAAINRKLDNL